MAIKALLLTATAVAVLAGHAMAQPPARPAPTDLPTTRAGAIERLAGDLEHNYSIPEVGVRYAAMLRANLAKGDYDKPADPPALAKQLSADLQAVNPDKHLKVMLTRVAPAPGAPPRAPRQAIDDAKWLEPGIAYIRFTEFNGSPEEVAAVDAFMRDHVTAKAIIIDARGHHGGGLAEMNVMLPYLYAKPTVLVDMDVAESVAHANDPLLDDEPALHRIAGPKGIVRREHMISPHPTEHRLFDAKVYYLTSTHTASAAEHLALAFKRTHRATLVGEHTAGANHFGGPEPIGLGLDVWLPVGRTIDPDTGKDWEGTGVLPDVEVPADQALETAVKLAKG